MAVRGIGEDAAVKKKYDDSKRTIKRILAPYIGKLKRIGAIRSSWQYSFKYLPLTDEWKGYLAILAKIPGSMSYWNNDILPLKSVREEYAKKRSKKRARAEKESGRPSRGFELSRPSLWHRFDNWVSGIGDWFADKMHYFSDWMMKSWIWFLVAYVVIGLIVLWINEGFFAAFLGGIIVFFIIGLLASALEFIIALFTVIVKYITCAPFFVLRCIFYRGWTFLLFLIGVFGLLAYIIIP